MPVFYLHYFKFYNFSQNRQQKSLEVVIVLVKLPRSLLDGGWNRFGSNCGERTTKVRGNGREREREGEGER